MSEAKIQKLEEQVVQLNALITWICDKQKTDINAVLTMLFTVPANAEIIRENLADPADQVVLDRVVAKWNKDVVVNEESKILYPH